MTNTILAENWNYTFYKHGDLKAIISMGRDFAPNDKSDSYFLVSVIDGENNDLFQRRFDLIDAACRYLNAKYAGIWEFNSLEKPTSSGGCSTCVAH